MFKKAIIIVAVLFNLLISFPVSAAPVDSSSNIPELNPFCWRRRDCYAMRKQFLAGTATNAELEQGFIHDSSVAPCLGGSGDDQWGRCLPAGQTKTEISFGGQDKFSNIGEFIVVMYKYLLTIASIVAVIMIIVAGVQWITSGGNSEGISSAKKRIAGAIIGLFIAYMSYFVLNTINPALVNLRLPQVWLTRPQTLMPEFCDEIPNATDGKIFFAYIGTIADEPYSSISPNSTDYKYTMPDKSVFHCGNQFLVDNGGRASCVARDCPDENGEKQACYNTTGKQTGPYKCGSVIISGNISYTALVNRSDNIVGQTFQNVTELIGFDVATQWGKPPVYDTGLIIICEDQEELEEVGNKRGGIYGVAGYANPEFQYAKGWTDWDPNVRFLPKRRAELDIDTSHGESQNHYIVVGSGKISDTMELADRLCGPNKTRGFVLRAIMRVPKYVADQGIGHLIGKNGIDLGEHQFWTYANKIDKKYLISVDEIKNGGAVLNFNAADVSYSAPLSRYQQYIVGQ